MYIGLVVLAKNEQCPMDIIMGKKKIKLFTTTINKNRTILRVIKIQNNYVMRYL